MLNGAGTAAGLIAEAGGATAVRTGAGSGLTTGISRWIASRTAAIETKGVAVAAGVELRVLAGTSLVSVASTEGTCGSGADFSGSVGFGSKRGLVSVGELDSTARLSSATEGAGDGFSMIAAGTAGSAGFAIAAGASATGSRLTAGVSVLDIVGAGAATGESGGASDRLIEKDPVSIGFNAGSCGELPGSDFLFDRLDVMAAC